MGLSWGSHSPGGWAPGPAQDPAQDPFAQPAQQPHSAPAQPAPALVPCVHHPPGEVPGLGPARGQPGTPGLEWGYSLQDVLARTPPWVVPDPGLPPDKSDPGTEAGAPLLLKTFQQAWKQRLDEGCRAGHGTHIVPTACPPDKEAGSGMPSRTRHFCKATGHIRPHCHSTVP